MIRAIRDYIAKPPPIPSAYIDGFLYFQISVWGAMLGIFTDDDAYKYINPYALYYLKGLCKIGLAGATAIKMFRSTGFADHLANKGQEPLPPISTAENAATAAQPTEIKP